MCVLLRKKTAFYDVDVIIYYGLEQSVMYCLYTVKLGSFETLFFYPASKQARRERKIEHKISE